MRPSARSGIGNARMRAGSIDRRDIGQSGRIAIMVVNRERHEPHAMPREALSSRICKIGKVEVARSKRKWSSSSGFMLGYKESR